MFHQIVGISLVLRASIARVDNGETADSSVLLTVETVFFFQAEDGIRDDLVTGVRRVLFRSDRKSTRLNSSHQIISYAVFCLKKKNWRFSCIRLGIITRSGCLDIMPALQLS